MSNDTGVGGMGRWLKKRKRKETRMACLQRAYVRALEDDRMIIKTAACEHKANGDQT